MGPQSRQSLTAAGIAHHLDPSPRSPGGASSAKGAGAAGRRGAASHGASSGDTDTDGAESLRSSTPSPSDRRGPAPSPRGNRRLPAPPRTEADGEAARRNQVIKGLFEFYDADRSGAISKAETYKYAKKCGFAGSPGDWDAEWVHIHRHIGLPPHGALTLDDFARWLNDGPEENFTETEVLEALLKEERKSASRTNALPGATDEQARHGEQRQSPSPDSAQRDPSLDLQGEQRPLPSPGSAQPQPHLDLQGWQRRLPSPDSARRGAPSASALPRRQLPPPPEGAFAGEAAGAAGAAAAAATARQASAASGSPLPAGADRRRPAQVPRAATVPLDASTDEAASASDEEQPQPEALLPGPPRAGKLPQPPRDAAPGAALDALERQGAPGSRRVARLPRELASPSEDDGCSAPPSEEEPPQPEIPRAACRGHRRLLSPRDAPSRGTVEQDPAAPGAPPRRPAGPRREARPPPEPSSEDDRWPAPDSEEEPPQIEFRGTARPAGRRPPSPHRGVVHQPVQAATRLMRAVRPGEARLIVAAQEAFALGDIVSVTSGEHSESRTIVGFGSLVLDRPLSHGYPPGAVVSKQGSTRRTCPDSQPPDPPQPAW
ncbi:unnamed protein product, partial [Prorocentrum cordatum]